MHILLTGLPKGGKSTILDKLVVAQPRRCGLATKEVVKNGKRVGFRIVTSAGSEQTIADVSKPTPLTTGRFYVDTQAIDSIVASLEEPAQADLLYIDEVGQMQLSSQVFRKLLDTYMQSGCDLFATVTQIYEDPMIDRLKHEPGSFLFSVTPRNRQQIADCISAALGNRGTFNKLPERVQIAAADLCTGYLGTDAYVSCRKLFSNALGYALSGQVIDRGDARYGVQGKHGIHIVDNDTILGWSCDCPLSRGTKPYAKAAECSHIQAIKLTRA